MSTNSKEPLYYLYEKLQGWPGEFSKAGLELCTAVRRVKDLPAVLDHLPLRKVPVEQAEYSNLALKEALTEAEYDCLSGFYRDMGVEIRNSKRRASIMDAAEKVAQAMHGMTRDSGKPTISHSLDVTLKAIKYDSTIPDWGFRGLLAHDWKEDVKDSKWRDIFFRLGFMETVVVYRMTKFSNDAGEDLDREDIDSITWQHLIGSLKSSTVSLVDTLTDIPFRIWMKMPATLAPLYFKLFDREDLITTAPAEFKDKVDAAGNIRESKEDRLKRVAGYTLRTYRYIAYLLNMADKAQLFADHGLAILDPKKHAKASDVLDRWNPSLAALHSELDDILHNVDEWVPRRPQLNSWLRALRERTLPGIMEFRIPDHVDISRGLDRNYDRMTDSQKLAREAQLVAPKVYIDVNTARAENSVIHVLSHYDPLRGVVNLSSRSQKLDVGAEEDYVYIRGFRSRLGVVPEIRIVNKNTMSWRRMRPGQLIDPKTQNEFRAQRDMHRFFGTYLQRNIGTEALVFGQQTEDDTPVRLTPIQIIDPYTKPAKQVEVLVPYESTALDALWRMENLPEPETITSFLEVYDGKVFPFTGSLTRTISKGTLYLVREPGKRFFPDVADIMNIKTLKAQEYALSFITERMKHDSEYAEMAKEHLYEFGLLNLRQRLEKYHFSPEVCELAPHLLDYIGLFEIPGADESEIVTARDLIIRIGLTPKRSGRKKLYKIIEESLSHGLIDLTMTATVRKKALTDILVQSALYIDEVRAKGWFCDFRPEFHYASYRDTNDCHYRLIAYIHDLEYNDVFQSVMIGLFDQRTAIE